MTTYLEDLETSFAGKLLPMCAKASPDRPGSLHWVALGEKNTLLREHEPLKTSQHEPLPVHDRAVCTCADVWFVVWTCRMCRACWSTPPWRRSPPLPRQRSSGLCRTPRDSLKQVDTDAFLSACYGGQGTPSSKRSFWEKERPDGRRVRWLVMV